MAVKTAPFRQRAPIGSGYSANYSHSNTGNLVGRKRTPSRQRYVAPNSAVDHQVGRLREGPQSSRPARSMTRRYLAKVYRHRAMTGTVGRSRPRRSVGRTGSTSTANQTARSSHGSVRPSVCNEQLSGLLSLESSSAVFERDLTLLKGFCGRLL